MNALSLVDSLPERNRKIVVYVVGFLQVSCVRVCVCVCACARACVCVCACANDRCVLLCASSAVEMK